jgi:hypothetical protein
MREWRNTSSHSSPWAVRFTPRPTFVLNRLVEIILPWQVDLESCFLLPVSKPTVTFWRSWFVSCLWKRQVRSLRIVKPRKLICTSEQPYTSSVFYSVSHCDMCQVSSQGPYGHPETWALTYHFHGVRIQKNNKARTELKSIKITWIWRTGQHVFKCFSRVRQALVLR